MILITGFQKTVSYRLTYGQTYIQTDKVIHRGAPLPKSGCPAVVVFPYSVRPQDEHSPFPATKVRFYDKKFLNQHFVKGLHSQVYDGVIFSTYVI